MNKKSPFERTAESWELAVNKNGKSRIENGETLEDCIAKNEGCLGEGCDALPILIKLIDAKESLSVQVHPTDEYAKLHEGCLGKSEMWYIIDCDEGAKLYCGFKQDTNREEVISKIGSGTFCDLLSEYEVKKGDAFYIPSGEVHAIGGGILLMEIQENSDVTYRVYDYGRGRRLDLKKAFDVMNMKKSGGARVKLPLECEYFNVRKLKLPEDKEMKMSMESFAALTVTEGSCIIYANGKKIAFERGETAFVPAQDGVVKLEGNGEIIAVERGSK
ncbi:MAG: mannose-6-phosphate isomerase [Clostridia bacterium]|nr:mannose-6-phosphate isomerase [Clostridia bacterium]